MLSRALVVDANIVVRAVLGKRVRDVFEAYAGDVTFLFRVSSPDCDRELCSAGADFQCTLAEDQSSFAACFVIRSNTFFTTWSHRTA